ncbi:MAG: hypothetical protein JNL01_04800 [Bdellovibrionales bacterium]|nr:hypothetical protein [Bdellovibrionales bacterium]
MLSYGFTLRIISVLEHWAFWPLHFIVRQVYRLGVPILLRLGLRAWNPRTYRTWVRHSTSTGKDFHFLLSDVDLALAISSQTSPEKVQSLVQTYRTLRRIFKMLGELEIYLPGEYEERMRIESLWAPWIQGIRDIRKIQWIRDGMQSRPSPYHQYKAHRVLARLGNAVQNLESTVPASRVWKLQARRSRFYARTVPSPDFSPSLNQWLLQLIPQADGGVHAPDPRWSSLRQALMTHERLCYRAYLRELQATMWPKDEWLSILDAELSASDPIDHYTLQVGQRILNHLEEKSVSQDALLSALEEERALKLSKKIHVNQPGLENWVHSVYPELSSKLVLDFEWQQRRKDIPRRNPSPNTLTFIGPQSVRFGWDRWEDLLKKIQVSAVNPLHVEVNPDVPSGVLVLPYKYRFLDEEKAIQGALQTGLPAVIGFDDRLLDRVLAVMDRSAIDIAFHFQRTFQPRFM